LIALDLKDRLEQAAFTVPVIADNAIDALTAIDLHHGYSPAAAMIQKASVLNAQTGAYQRSVFRLKRPTNETSREMQDALKNQNEMKHIKK
jgi:hypothetical protein